MAETTFTAIIISYQQRDLTLEALRSVLRQTRPPEQVVVVVDGSRDGTAEAIRAAPGAEKVVVIEQENRGRSLARNRGVAAASGRWVAFLDGDDAWHPEKLARCEEWIAAHPDVRAVWHHVYTVATEPGLDTDLIGPHWEDWVQAAKGGAPYGPQEYRSIEGHSFDKLLASCVGSTSSTVVERDLFIMAGGFPAHMCIGEDWAFYMAVARLTEWSTIEAPLTFSRQHPAQITRGGEYRADEVLAGVLIGFWYSGRPLIDFVAPKVWRARLQELGPQYRHYLHHLIWGAMKQRRFDEAFRLWRFARLLMLSRRDRWLLTLPLPAAYRLERLLPGAPVLPR